MDDYLESYVDKVMDDQILRNGIFRASPMAWLRSIFSKR